MKKYIFIKDVGGLYSLYLIDDAVTWNFYFDKNAHKIYLVISTGESKSHTIHVDASTEILKAVKKSEKNKSTILALFAEYFCIALCDFIYNNQICVLRVDYALDEVEKAVYEAFFLTELKS